MCAYNVDALQMCPIECTLRDIIEQHSSSLTAWQRRSNNFFVHIVNAHKEGKGYRAISKQFQVQESTTQSIIRKNKTFNSLKNIEGCSRKPAVSPCLARKVLRKANNNPQITINALLNNPGNYWTKISWQTLQHIWHMRGLHGGRPRKTLLLKRDTEKLVLHRNQPQHWGPKAWISVQKCSCKC